MYIAFFNLAFTRKKKNIRKLYSFFDDNKLRKPNRCLNIHAILESAMVRSEMDVVLFCETLSKSTLLPLLISQCFIIMRSRVGCYYRLAFHRWSFIY